MEGIIFCIKQLGVIFGIAYQGVKLKIKFSPKESPLYLQTSANPKMGVKMYLCLFSHVWSVYLHMKCINRKKYSTNIFWWTTTCGLCTSIFITIFAHSFVVSQSTVVVLKTQEEKPYIKRITLRFAHRKKTITNDVIP